MRPWLPLACAAALACSNITADDSGVIALDVQVPARLELEVGDTIQLAARALDRNGDPTDATITWQTPDTTVTVDAVTGRATGRAGDGTTVGRVQAAEGTLVSDFLTFTVLGRADSVALPGGATIVVPPATASSAPLNVRLLGAAGVGLAGHRVVFTVTAPVFADTALRTVELSNAGLVDTVRTAADGTLATPVTLNRVAGRTAPATAVVRVQVTRPSGATVPGSGQQFTVTFQ